MNLLKPLLLLATLFALSGCGDKEEDSGDHDHEEHEDHDSGAE